MFVRGLYGGLCKDGNVWERNAEIGEGFANPPYKDDCRDGAYFQFLTPFYAFDATSRYRLGRPGTP